MPEETFRKLLLTLRQPKLDDDALTFIRLVVPTLYQDTVKLKKENAELKGKIGVDGLTGLLEKKPFFLILDEILKLARDHDQEDSIIMGDLDHFKKYNDAYGHIQGDMALKTIAHVIKNTVKDSDIVSKYGGEEFALLLPETSINTAIDIAKKIKSRVEQTVIPPTKINLPDKGYEHITMSLGIFTYNTGLNEFLKNEHEKAQESSALEERIEFSLKDAVIDAADIALYRAKIKRNSIVVYEHGMQMPKK